MQTGSMCLTPLIDAADMTISLFRHSYPRQLFVDLERLHAIIETRHPGVYYVSGIINIPVQIVVAGRLEADIFSALRILTDKAKESDVRRFIAESVGIDSKVDKQNIDAILQVSVSANDELYRKIRRETTMCEALRELMKDEIEKTERDTKIKTRYEDGMPVELIAEKSKVSVEVVKDVLIESGMLSVAK